MTSSFVARQTKFLPLSCLVGVNSSIDVVMLPSGDVYELIIEKQWEKLLDQYQQYSRNFMLK